MELVELSTERLPSKNRCESSGLQIVRLTKENTTGSCLAQKRMALNYSCCMLEIINSVAVFFGSLDVKKAAPVYQDKLVYHKAMLESPIGGCLHRGKGGTEAGDDQKSWNER